MNRTSNRIEKLRKSLRADRADALLVASVTNVSYLTGFTGDDSTFLLTPTRALVISDGRYTTQLQQECPDLEPERKPSEILATLKKQAAAEHIVLVGHEPSMHEILSFLLTGSAGGISLEMKKGGAALVHFDASIRAGAASLLWLLPPRLVLSAAKD